MELITEGSGLLDLAFFKTGPTQTDFFKTGPTQTELARWRNGMPVYVVVEAAGISDQLAYDTKLMPMVQPILNKYGKRIGLGTGASLRVFRNSNDHSVQRVVVLEFPDETAAVSWWNDMEPVLQEAEKYAKFSVYGVLGRSLWGGDRWPTRF
jgi:uncharacterized protein (DUF1330 family)